MEKEIKSKLGSALSERIKKECQVLYILAEVRKLLERLKDKDNFPVLNFYSNWVLHPEISNTSAVRPLLEKIEKNILNKEHNTWIIWKMIDFDEFRKEMGLFLNKFNIVDPFVNRKYWDNFRNLFVDILTDCPLKPNYGDMKEFCFMKSLEKGDINFTIKFKNHIPIRGSFSVLDSEKIIKKYKKTS